MFDGQAEFCFGTFFRDVGRGQTVNGVLVSLERSVAKNLMNLSSIWSPPILVECEDART